MHSSTSAELPDLISITELRSVASQVPQVYRVRAQMEAVVERTASTGSLYLEARLADGADGLMWRAFDNNPCFHQLRDLPRAAFVEISAEWIDGGKFGIEPRNARMRLLNEEEKQALLGGDPETVARQHEDWRFIMETLGGIQDPRLQGICGLFVERFGDRYRRTAAARENHHARRGGLVEHVAQMMRSGLALCGVYPELNRDLLMAGILFHDCGKMWENSYPEVGFTQPIQLHGEMLGHIPLGLELVNKLWRDVMDSPEATAWTLLDPSNENVRLHLLHLIASHHGQLEFGSPVLPKTPEAITLHYVDNIDAKLEMLRRAYATSKEVAPQIFDRFRPWPTRIIAPLSVIQCRAPKPEADEEAEGSSI